MSDSELQVVQASSTGDFDTVKTLVSKIDVNQLDSKGRNALGMAIFYQHLNIIKLLLEEFNIDPNLEIRAGPAFDITLPLLLACETENLEILSLILSHPHIDPNKTSIIGKNALHLVACSDNTKLMTMLLKHPKIDPTLPTRRFETNALHLACMYRQYNMVKLLLEDGRIDPTFKDSQLLSPLHYACSSGREDIAELLLDDPRTDPNAEDAYGSTPLTKCVSRIDITPDIPSVVKILLEDHRTKMNLEMAHLCVDMCRQHPDILIQITFLVCVLRDLSPSLVLQCDYLKYEPLVIQQINKSRIKSARK